ncbi:zinc finger CCCH domain-containing protein 14 [Colias croceus]|uniref:zinc finger CCCH domain-containing protein 14 n=1 Tax=Colias crocea TaxID=72248 RepID=UPI001E27FDFC|nr:zinc finger CCCH domain-containing protein 14 [Colias croceus]
MDVVGSEIGQKMRSAIKAKLTELGCYVDDELPDYVMVMVANKRTQLQMEDDLQLFLGDNTELFVNWLHQVLKKLQEVTVAVPLKNDKDKHKERSVSKERKSKEKKEKSKKNEVLKKAKKKDKIKTHKKEEKKLHKSKKEKKKSHERIRPNIPPLLMNMEKDSEPSITDVFAGQILKNHGVSLDSYKDDLKIIETKPVLKEAKRPILPIIDPATILSQSDVSNEATTKEVSSKDSSNSQLKEMNDIEAKIQGLKQKLVEQLDSMSDDEDFLNIRTEAEELMNDFADDVLQEISQPAIATPPIKPTSPLPKTPSEPPKMPSEPPKLPFELPKPAKRPLTPPKETHKESPEILPQIELNLPKRPIRERLGAREITKKPEVKETERQKSRSPESFTPERELDSRPQTKPARSRLGSQSSETHRRISVSEDSPEKTESSSKKMTSRVSVLERPRVSCASVVRVRPRPRAPASNLLLRAVADAHKSLLNIPPKVDPEPQKVKRALVLPMRRCVDAKNIVIQVDRQTDDNNCDNSSKPSHRYISEKKDDCSPLQITKRILNTEYVPSRTATRKDDSLIIETINIHNPTVDKDKDTQFIVTMDGYHPNAFLAKKLKTEGLLDDDDDDTTNLNTPRITKAKDTVRIETMEDQDMQPIETVSTNIDTAKTIEEKVDEPVIEKESVPKPIDKVTKDNDETSKESYIVPKDKVLKVKNSEEKRNKLKEKPVPVVSEKKRLSDTSEDSDTQVIIKKEDEKGEKRKSVEVEGEKEKSPPVKKRKASPIVFDVDKKEIDRQVRERTLSASSDSHVTLSSVANSNKYDSIPPLSQAERKVIWCRAFPLCRYGASCAFAHPRCKFLAACTRRGCAYSHEPAAPALPQPALASHVVPVANYKTISSAIPSMCKYYPNCANPACHFYHPKPCRFGKACANKLECNFYHNDVPKYPL